MSGLLRQICESIARSLSREPTMRFGAHSSREGLPPVLGPHDWSHGLLQSMADSGTAWYFDRR